MGTLGLLSLLATVALTAMGVTPGGWGRRSAVLILAAIAVFGSLRLQWSSEATIARLEQKVDDANNQVRDSRQAIETSVDTQNRPMVDS